MRGYNFPRPELMMEMGYEDVYVGCRRCSATWYENTLMVKNGIRINGPWYRYDCCDKCITDEERKDVRQD